MAAAAHALSASSLFISLLLILLQTTLVFPLDSASSISLSAPFLVDVYLYSKAHESLVKELKQSLSDTLSVHHIGEEDGVSSVAVDVVYRVTSLDSKFGQWYRDFITSNGSRYSNDNSNSNNNGNSNGNSNDNDLLLTVNAVAIQRAMKDLQSPTFNTAPSISSISIVVIDNVDSLPKHAIEDGKGNCVASYYDHVMFIDLSAKRCSSPMNKILPLITHELSSNWPHLKDDIPAIRTQWLAAMSSIAISGFKTAISGPVRYRSSLMTDRIYIPIVILQSGDVNSNLEHQFDIGKFNISSIKKWASSMLGDSQDIMIKHNVYWIDEHPQIAVSLSVSLSSFPAPATSTGMDGAPAHIPFIDSSTLSNDMAGISDHLVHNLVEKWGIDEDLDNLMDSDVRSQEAYDSVISSLRHIRPDLSHLDSSKMSRHGSTSDNSVNDGSNIYPKKGKHDTSANAHAELYDPNFESLETSLRKKRNYLTKIRSHESNAVSSSLGFKAFSMLPVFVFNDMHVHYNKMVTTSKSAAQSSSEQSRGITPLFDGLDEIAVKDDSIWILHSSQNDTMSFSKCKNVWTENKNFEPSDLGVQIARGISRAISGIDEFTNFCDDPSKAMISNRIWAAGGHPFPPFGSLEYLAFERNDFKDAGADLNNIITWKIRRTRLFSRFQYISKRIHRLKHHSESYVHQISNVAQTISGVGTSRGGRSASASSPQLEIPKALADEMEKLQKEVNTTVEQFNSAILAFSKSQWSDGMRLVFHLITDLTRIEASVLKCHDDLNHVLRKCSISYSFNDENDKSKGEFKSSYSKDLLFPSSETVNSQSNKPEIFTRSSSLSTKSKAIKGVLMIVFLCTVYFLLKHMTTLLSNRAKKLA